MGTLLSVETLLCGDPAWCGAAALATVPSDIPVQPQPCAAGAVEEVSQAQIPEVLLNNLFVEHSPETSSSWVPLEEGPEQTWPIIP